MNKKLLVFSYAFPPLKVPMMPVVSKHLDIFSKLGYDVDVLCPANNHLPLGKDHSLEYFVQSRTSSIHHLELNKPPSSSQNKRIHKKIPDMAASISPLALDYLTNNDLEKYRAIITFSPFHSINKVMLDVKKKFPMIPWIAQFSDPWAKNPLETRLLAKLWNSYFESKVLAAADVIVNCSRYSLDLMLKGKEQNYLNKCHVIPHFFVNDLYPTRPKEKNHKIMIRFVGTLFGQRKPNSFLEALEILLIRRADLQSEIAIEIIGEVPENIRKVINDSVQSKNIIKIKPSVTYLDSLELMHDSDILLLIEADVKNNLFFPSKLIDYLGANRRIVAMVSPGCTQDICKDLNTWHALASDTNGLSFALEAAIDDAIHHPTFEGYNESVRSEYSVNRVAEIYESILNKTL